jgi:hypothetical protein
MRKFPASALVVVSLAAVALGVRLAGDAAAFDRTIPARGWAKDAPHLGKAARKRAAVSGAPLPGARQGPHHGLVSPKGQPLSQRPTHRAPVANQHPASPRVANQHSASDRVANRHPAAHRFGSHHHNRIAAGKHHPAAGGHRSAIGPHIGRRHEWSGSIAHRHMLRVEHRRAILSVRSMLPRRPLPGERDFTGVPPVGEARFVATEMVLQARANVSQQSVDSVARRLGLSIVGSQSIALTGGTLFHLRMSDRRQMADVVRALEAENIGIAQPNYVYRLQQDANLAARTKATEAGQYVLGKLQLPDAHRVATGRNVLVAMIDSAVDAGHPDLAGAIVEQFDAVGRRDQPHVHGTGMAGAIAARRKLMGVAPGARVLAISAFSPDASESPQATTQHVLAGLEWAIKKGARVINMSFAGPYDPMLQLALKNARERGIVLIAAAGNLGSKSPPLYPAADPNVIAVTATDADDKHFAQANQGPHVAVSAPGVDVLEPAPNGGYQLTTGTSVAAAHVSGVVALLIERDPSLDPVAIHEILTLSARDLGSKGRDDTFGWGLVDPSRALQELDLKVAEQRKGNKPPAARPGPVSSR